MSKTKKPEVKKKAVAKKTALKKPAVKKTAQKTVKKTAAPKRPAVPTFADCYKDDKKLADVIAEILDGFNAKDVVVVDLKDLSPVTNFFVIATSNSTTHGRGVADRVIETLKKEHNTVAANIGGMDNSNWVIIDYIGVVVHVFSQSQREHFDLEGLWEGKIKTYSA